MRIAKLTYTGFAGLGDGSLDFARDGGVPSDVIVVTGPPGSGKTRLLELIIAGKERVAPYGPRPRLDDVIAPGGSAAKIIIDWWLSEEERAFVGVNRPFQTTEAIYARSGPFELAPDPAIGVLLERYDHDPSHGKIDYLPADRGLPSFSTMVSDPVFDQRPKRLARGPDKYAGLVKLASDAILRRTDTPRIDALRALFTELCPHLRLGGVTASGDIEAIRADGSTTPASRLSMSEKQALAIASSLVLVGVHGSIVLYDTPELYLSGAEARRWLEILKNHAPTNQWIVATTADEVVAMTPQKNVVRFGAPR